DLRTEDREIFHLADIPPAFDATAAEVRTVTVEDDGSRTQASGFHLNPCKYAFFFNDQIVPVILPERDRYMVTCERQRVKSGYLRNIAYAFRIPAKRCSIHTGKRTLS
ncbi:MAG TPA: hypothetical protein VK760_03580, partial [Candidatus Acidoferrales bacterium]|nr:hypothetical protein [Candidatus Acidoferrales bacterium]